MDETVESCVCGNGNVGSSSTLTSVSRYCLYCGRKGMSSASGSLAIGAWNRDMRALKAAREPKPETKKNKVYAGEWYAREEWIFTRYHDGTDECVGRVDDPNDLYDESCFPNCASNTAKLMAASKGMYRLLKGFLDGEFNDGASSAVIEGAEKLITKLDLDVD